MHKVGDFVFYAFVTAGQREKCKHCGGSKPSYKIDVQECLITRIRSETEVRLYGQGESRIWYTIQVRNEDGNTREHHISESEACDNAGDALKIGQCRITDIESYEQELDLDFLEPTGGDDPDE